jgi:hypothetical protein
MAQCFVADHPVPPVGASTGSIDAVNHAALTRMSHDAKLHHPQRVLLDNNDPLQAAGERLVALILGDGP